MNPKSRSRLDALKAQLDAPPPPPTQAQIEAELWNEFHRLMDASPDGRIPKHILKDLRRREAETQALRKVEGIVDPYTEFRSLLLEDIH
jgi:hypothetical protein